MSKAAMPNSPYKGLIPYSEEDALFFFGREADCEIITANLMASRLTLLYGPSGVGKSSVLRAGVAHHLRDQARQNLKEQGTAEFAVVVFSAWRDNPLEGLAAEVQNSVARTLGESSERISTNGSLADVLKNSARRIGGRLLIILDQFEEYFLYHGQENGAGTFANEFPQAVNDPELSTSFMISIREDALAKLDRFEESLPNIFDRYLRIEHLDRDSAREAIIEPLDQYNLMLSEGVQGVSIEPKLVEEILDQVKTGQVILGEAGRGVVEGEDGDAQIETPFLQLVMTELWNKTIGAGSRLLELKTLKKLGGAKSIIEAHLDDKISRLKVEGRDTAARVFRYLVTPTGTKIALSADDLAQYVKLNPEQINPVLEELSKGDTRILRPVPPPVGDRGPFRYEIFHDVLAPAILRYATARESVETERQLEREKKIVRRQWLSLAVMGVLLALMIGAVIYAFNQRAEANTQKNEANTQKNNAQAALMEVSKTRDALQLSLKSEEEQRVIAQAERAEAERQKTAAEKATVEALAQRKAAEKAKEIADSEREKAVTAALKATEQQIIAQEARKEAEGQKKIAQSRELAANAVAQSNVDPELAVVLATEALKVTPTVQAEEALRQTLLALSFRFELQGYNVSRAAFSPDGKLIVTAIYSRSARIWDANTGQSVRELQGHTGAVTSAVFSPDGKLIVTASGDGTARIWDASTGQSVRELRGHTSDVFSAAFSPDGKHIVTASHDNSARVWDAGTGQGVQELRGHTRSVTSAVFSPDGKLIVTGSGDNTARIWDASTGQSVRELRGHTDNVSSAEFSPDGKLIVTSSFDKSARVWDASTGQSVKELRGHTFTLYSAAFSPDGKLIVTASGDGTARVWSSGAGQSVRELRGHTRDVYRAEFSPDGKFIVTASGDNTARIWDASTGQIVRELRGDKFAVYSAEFSPDGKLIVTVASDGATRIWDASTGQSVRELREHIDNISSAAFSPDGKLIVTVAGNRAPRIWDAGTGQSVRELQGHPSYLHSAAFSPDGKFIVTASFDKSVRVWDASTGQSVRELRGHTDNVFSAVFSPDGKLIVTGSGDGTAHIWDASTGQIVRELRGHIKGVRRAAFSPDGKFIVTASFDKSVRVWDASTGQSVRELRGHTDNVFSAVFSPDGKLIVTGSGDGTARIYPYESFAPLDVLQTMFSARVNRKLTKEEKEKYLPEQ